MHIYTYDIPICSPLLAISRRRGLIFETEHGWGEAAPLPGWSQETIDDLILSPFSHPSSDFALRCVQTAFPSAFPSIPLAALVTNISEAENAILSGFQTLKIKIRDYSVCDAINLISRMQIPNIRLRIDINRRWSFNDAHLFLSQLNPAGIEYIEEPTHDLDQLRNLPPFPLALDETLKEPQQRWIHLPNLHAFVLKPTLLGKRLDYLIQLGQKQNKKLVFSSSFESAIGLIHIAHLQARFSPQTAVGLDTHRFFLGNFFPMPINNGMLDNYPLPPMDRRWLTNYVP